MRRIELATKSDRVGCLSLSGLLLVLAAASVIPDPRLGWVYLLLVPFLPLAVPIFRSQKQAIGKELEVERNEIRLVHGDQTLWRLARRDLLTIRSRDNTQTTLVDRAGKTYDLPTVFRPQPFLQTWLPQGGSRETVIRRWKVDRRLASLAIIVAVAALVWGGQGFMQFQRLTALAAEGLDSSVVAQQKALPFGGYVLAIITGIAFLLFGLFSIRPSVNTGARTHVREVDWIANPLSLDAYLLADGMSPWQGRDLSFRCKEQTSQKLELFSVVLSVLVFGGIFISLLIATFVAHETWTLPMAGLYLPIVAFVLYAARCNAQERITDRWTVRVRGELIEAVDPSSGSVWPLRVKRLGRAFMLSANGKSISSNHFVLDPPSMPDAM